MAITRERFIDILANSYSAYYDITMPDGETELPLAFTADYHSRDERYWLTKSISVWGNEMNEFVYIFSAPDFDVQAVDRCVDYALREGLPRVKPHKEHQYTNIKVLFVANAFDKQTVKHIQKCKFQKSYKFSLHGFTMLKTAAVDLSAAKAFPNKDGYELEKYFNKLFASAEKSAAADK